MAIIRGRFTLQRVGICTLFIALCAQADPRLQLGDRLGNLPLHFERNTGQADSKAFFVTRSGTGLAALMADGVAFRLNGVSGDTTVKMTLKGTTNLDMVPAGEGQLQGKVNYLISSDPSRWHTDVPTYSQVRLRGSPGSECRSGRQSSRQDFERFFRTAQANRVSGGEWRAEGHRRCFFS